MPIRRPASAAALLVLSLFAASALAPAASAGIHPIEDEVDAFLLDASAGSMQGVRDLGRAAGAAVDETFRLGQAANVCARDGAIGTNDYGHRVVVSLLGSTDMIVAQLDDVSFPHLDDLVRIALGGADQGQGILVTYQELSARRAASALQLEEDLLTPIPGVAGGFFAAVPPLAFPDGATLVLDFDSSTGGELIEVGIGLVVRGDTPESALARLASAIDDAVALQTHLLPLLNDALSPVPNRVFNAGLELLGDVVNTTSDVVTGFDHGLEGILVQGPTAIVEVPPPSVACSLA